MPEEGNRKIIARIPGIGDESDFSLLEQIGGACADAYDARAFLAPDVIFDDPPENITVLSGDVLVLNGVRFLGSTLWTNFMLHGDGEAC